MLFAYTTLYDGPGPEVPLGQEQHKALLQPGCDALAILEPDLLSLGVPRSWVTRIDVETGDDCDADGYPDAANPITITVFPRGV